MRCLSQGLPVLASSTCSFWGAFPRAGRSGGRRLESLVDYESIQKWNLGLVPGRCPSTVLSPVQGDLPVGLSRQRHPVQAATVVRRIDATKHHHTATLVIAVGSGGKRWEFVPSFIPHSFAQRTEPKLYALEELRFQGFFCYGILASILSRFAVGSCWCQELRRVCDK